MPAPRAVVDESASRRGTPVNLLNRTSPETSLDPPPDSPIAPLPMFKTPPTPLPGAMNPDPAPAVEDHQGDGRANGASAGQTTSIPAFFRQRAKSYAKIAETLLTAVGGLLNTRAGEDCDAFLPDEEDRETIPPPIGRLAARRLKIGADPEQMNDLEDIGMAAVGLAVWAAKGLSALWEARRARRRLEDGKAVHNDTGDGQ
jgi:hypothetical protein